MVQWFLGRDSFFYKLYGELNKDRPMKWIVEDSLTNFNFWSGAADRAKMLEYSELQELDDTLPELFGDKIPTSTEINDVFWFDFGTVCSLIGLKYDESKGVIIRGDDDEDDDETDIPSGMREKIESIRKEAPALAEAIEAGFRACMESTEIRDAYQPDVVVDDEPNWTVILTHGGIDPHPARVSVQGYDEADAIETAINNLKEHGIEGYCVEEQPEFPGDYIEVSCGWIPSENVHVEKCSGIRTAYVPEHFLPALVNADRTGLSPEDEAELDEFCKDLAESGIPESGLNPVCGPDGEYWSVDDDPATGKSVLCSVFVGK